MLDTPNLVKPPENSAQVAPLSVVYQTPPDGAPINIVFESVG